MLSPLEIGFSVLMCMIRLLHVARPEIFASRTTIAGRPDKLAFTSLLASTQTTGAAQIPALVMEVGRHACAAGRTEADKRHMTKCPLVTMATAG